MIFIGTVGFHFIENLTWLDSVYVAMETVTTVGYGDVLPSVSWRLLGPIEAAVGILMLGWSTSIIVAAVQRIYNVRSPSSTS